MKSLLIAVLLFASPLWAQQAQYCTNRLSMDECSHCTVCVDRSGIQSFSCKTTCPLKAVVQQAEIAQTVDALGELVKVVAAQQQQITALQERLSGVEKQQQAMSEAMQELYGKCDKQ